MKKKRRIKRHRSNRSIRSVLGRSMIHRPTLRHRDRTKYTRKIKHKKNKEF